MTPDTAILFGVIVSTLLSSLTVVLAFMRPALRFTRSKVMGHAPTFADHLCAGIWSSAIGAALISCVSMVRLTSGVLFATAAAVAWCFICGGYFLHFTAWRASFRGEASGFHIRWAVILVTLGVASSILIFIALG